METTASTPPDKIAWGGWSPATGAISERFDNVRILTGALSETHFECPDHPGVFVRSGKNCWECNQ
jgi:hypothetical protein